MKLQVNAEWNGNELISAFLAQLKQNNIDALPTEVKILVKSKDDKEINLSPDRICLSYTKTQV
jgi:hypothetical protein